PAINACLVYDVGERAVTAVEIKGVGAAPLDDVKGRMPVVVDVAPDRVHAPPLAGSAADGSGGGHILERPIAPVPEQVVVVVPSGVDDVEVGITVAVIVGSRRCGADGAHPGHDIREDVAEHHHRMHVAATGGGSALLEVDLGAGIDCLSRGEPKIASPDKDYHHAGSKNESHTRGPVNWRWLSIPVITTSLNRCGKVSIAQDHHLNWTLAVAQVLRSPSTKALQPRIPCLRGVHPRSNA